MFDRGIAARSMPKFGGSTEDRHVSAFLDARVFDDASSAATLPDRVSEVIEVLRISALSSYEDKRISTGARTAAEDSSRHAGEAVRASRRRGYDSHGCAHDLRHTRNLTEMIDGREFPVGLFYRLSVLPIELPPLRERPEDICLLVRHLAADYAARMRKRITGISDEFMAALARHSWPGNVRELQNVIERSVIVSKGPVLNGSLSDLAYASKKSAPITLEEADRSHILQTLLQTEGVVGGPNGAAARLLESSPPLRSTHTFWVIRDSGLPPQGTQQEESS